MKMWVGVEKFTTTDIESFSLKIYNISGTRSTQSKYFEKYEFFE